MVAPKVRFLFGKHSGKGNRIEGDFFKNHAIPFIDEAVAKKRPLYIMFEEFVSLAEILELPDAETMLDKYLLINSSFSENERKIDEIILRIITQRIEEYSEEFVRADFKTVFDWGFNDYLAKVMKSYENIHPVSEIMFLCKDVLYMLNKADLFHEYLRVIGEEGEESVEILKKANSLYVALSYSRDVRLSNFVKLVCSNHKNAMFLIPRGALHRPMLKMFDANEYEIEVFDQIDPYAANSNFIDAYLFTISKMLKK